MAESRILLRIELVDIKPTIWRRFFFPADITLDRFHDVVQEVMGWYNEHLWEFTTKDQRFIPVQDDEGSSGDTPHN